MKYLLDMTVVDVVMMNERCVLIKLTDYTKLPEMLPGQFVQVRIDNSVNTFLRRPISINFVDREKNQLWLLVQMIGDGTKALGKLQKGDRLNLLLPLGNGFSAIDSVSGRVLLVGGGVGIAPMLEYGHYFSEHGIKPTFLLGGKSASDLLELDYFKKYGDVYVTTEDGSLGERGFVTQHSVLAQKFDHIAVCGPKPMMMAVVKYARQADVPCEVSLENMMACGVGACLCCVEKTVRGNVCVCTEGPVFKQEELNW